VEGGGEWLGVGGRGLRGSHRNTQRGLAALTSRTTSRAARSVPALPPPCGPGVPTRPRVSCDEPSKNSRVVAPGTQPSRRRHGCVLGAPHDESPTNWGEGMERCQVPLGGCHLKTSVGPLTASGVTTSVGQDPVTTSGVTASAGQYPLTPSRSRHPPSPHNFPGGGEVGMACTENRGKFELWALTR